MESIHLKVGFILRCFQHLSLWAWLLNVYPWRNNWYTIGSPFYNPLVLEKAPFNALTPKPDMDQTVSRRSEPSSRTTLMGEQPNPWNVLPLQDVMNRHRGAKPSRRCELLGKISLFGYVNVRFFILTSLSFLKAQTMSSSNTASPLWGFLTSGKG
jgi:hypothetical protein